MLLRTAQLHPKSSPVQAWKLCWMSKPEKKSDSQACYFPVAHRDFTWTTWSSARGVCQKGTQHPCPCAHPDYKQKGASKERQGQFLQWFCAWCEKQFKWPEVSGSSPPIQAFQIPAACGMHLGNNHFILLNCHRQLSQLSVAIRVEFQLEGTYNSISSYLDKEDPVEQYKTQGIRVSTLHPWQDIPTYLVVYEVVPFF